MDEYMEGFVMPHVIAMIKSLFIQRRVTENSSTGKHARIYTDIVGNFLQRILRIIVSPYNVSFYRNHVARL